MKRKRGTWARVLRCRACTTEFSESGSSSWPTCSALPAGQVLDDDTLEGNCPLDRWQQLDPKKLEHHPHTVDLQSFNDTAAAVVVYVAFSRLADKAEKKAFLDALRGVGGDAVLSKNEAKWLKAHVDLGIL